MLPFEFLTNFMIFSIISNNPESKISGFLQSYFILSSIKIGFTNAFIYLNVGKIKIEDLRT